MKIFQAPEPNPEPQKVTTMLNDQRTKALEPIAQEINVRLRQALFGVGVKPGDTDNALGVSVAEVDFAEIVLDTLRESDLETVPALAQTIGRRAMLKIRELDVTGDEPERYDAQVAAIIEAEVTSTAGDPDPAEVVVAFTWAQAMHLIRALSAAITRLEDVRDARALVRHMLENALDRVMRATGKVSR